MKLNIVVLAKQVPDTRNVGPDAMTPEGTVHVLVLLHRAWDLARPPTRKP